MNSLENLEAKRIDLLAEKSANTERLQEVNLELKSKPKGARLHKLNNERQEIIADNEEVIEEIREVVLEIKKLHRQQGGHESRGDLNLFAILAAPKLAKKGMSGPDVARALQETSNNLLKVKAAYEEHKTRNASTT